MSRRNADSRPFAASGTPLRVGLLGPYASVNLGDTSIQLAVMHALRERLGPVRFLGISTDPADVVRTHGIAAFDSSGAGPILGSWVLEPPRGLRAARRLPGRVFRLLGIDRVLSTLDLLIFSGSGQIDDFWGGPWERPFLLLAWSALARRHRVPVAFLGVGVDDLNTRLGGWFSVRALELARFRAFRDAGSVERLRTLGLKAPTRVCPDPAFGLPVPPPRPGAEPRRPYALICPIAREAWPGGEDAVYEGYLQALADVAGRLLGKGLDVRFACSQTRMDPRAVRRVLDKMDAADAARCGQESIASVDDYLSLAGQARVVIASRLHAAILALVAGAPVITVAQPRKVRRLMQDLGLQDWHLDLGEARSDAVWAKVEAALAAGPSLRKRLAGQGQGLRDALAATYDGLLEAVIPEMRARASRPGRSD